MMEEALGHLQALGFTDYEARAYVTLLQKGPLTGYQVARDSGIPRPNVYPVLDRLEQRGTVVRIAVKEGVKYAARPASELLAQLSRNVQSHLEGARRVLSEVGDAGAAHYVWNIQGYDNFLDRAEAAIDGAETVVLAGLWAEESRRLGAAFRRAEARGVALSILCLQACPEECGGCRGSVYRYAGTATPDTRWVVIVTDDAELLVGQIAPSGVSGAATSLAGLAAMAGQYLRNSIAIAEIVRSVGPGLPGLLDSPARLALDVAGPAPHGEGWVESLLSLSRDRP